MKRLLALVLFFASSNFLCAQPPAITKFELGSTTLSSGGSVSDGTITSVSGSAGANPGFSYYTYGNPTGANTQNLTINAVSSVPATMKLWSAASLTPTTSGVANGFLANAPATWKVIQKEPLATAGSRIRLSVGDTTLTNYFNLDDSGGSETLAVYNARLNSVLKFDATEFYKTTGVPISAADGTFSFTFTDFTGGRYTNIALTYTPVPEPATIGLLGFGMLAAIRFGRRLRSDKLVKLLAS